MSQCTICLEENTDFKCECGHCFHNKCITQWLMFNSDCCPTLIKKKLLLKRRTGNTRIIESVYCR